MGKTEDEEPLPMAAGGELTPHLRMGSRRCCWRINGWVSYRCVFALIFGTAVLLSAVFSLPIFNSGDPKVLDLDDRFAGYEIVASFMLERPVSLLEQYILQLENEILDEISVSNTKVNILSLESPALLSSNKTKVFFAVDSSVKTVGISPTAKTIIHDNFESILVHQSTLHLTTASLFGTPFSFEVLKFKGGITVSPSQQKAFLLQKVLISFNFTLNFSIEEIQVYFDQLTQQLKWGLHLSPYENLYISLVNVRGSTVDPPTIVRSRVVLVVGVPSRSREKQLAQAITGSHAKNLGLNNTVFGRVKQVTLSSTTSVNSGTPSPSPAPVPHNLHPYHRHHHHHHHSSPAPSIVPSPTQRKSVRVNRKPSPTPMPVLEPAHRPTPCKIGPTSHMQAAAPPTNLEPNKIAPSAAPSLHEDPPPTSDPLPHVIYSLVPSPLSSSSHSVSDAEPPDKAQFISYFSSSASTGSLNSSCLWALLFFLIALHA
ncbi:unnamed protein product [Cuscuta campestris]|uniref:DUF7036 domain-containing protein n=1 Tax=Cuscuta campestris TaxID=132261 RepID=A0A484KW61_9ASTE|nr:unnamed protein product [Cuscuta campestris]